MEQFAVDVSVLRSRKYRRPPWLIDLPHARGSILLFSSFCPFHLFESSCVTAIKGRPKSRTLLSKPCSAAWSITEPRMTVVPSLSCVRLSPSNQAAHRASRCPLRRISYCPSSRRVSGDACVSLMCSFLPWFDHKLERDVMSAPRHM